MNAYLTIAEINDRYDSEWVLLDQPETDESHDVMSGQVIAHSKDRDEVYRRAVELRPRRFAILYTGEIPENAVIVL